MERTPPRWWRTRGIRSSSSGPGGAQRSASTRRGRRPWEIPDLRGNSPSAGATPRGGARVQIRANHNPIYNGGEGELGVGLGANGDPLESPRESISPPAPYPGRRDGDDQARGWVSLQRRLSEERPRHHQLTWLAKSYTTGGRGNLVGGTSQRALLLDVPNHPTASAWQDPQGTAATTPRASPPAPSFMPPQQGRCRFRRVSGPGPRPRGNHLGKQLPSSTGGARHPRVRTPPGEGGTRRHASKISGVKRSRSCSRRASEAKGGGFLRRGLLHDPLEATIGPHLQRGRGGIRSGGMLAFPERAAALKPHQFRPPPAPQAAPPPRRE